MYDVDSLNFISRNGEDKDASTKDHQKLNKYTQKSAFRYNLHMRLTLHQLITISSITNDRLCCWSAVNEKSGANENILQHASLPFIVNRIFIGSAWNNYGLASYVLCTEQQNVLFYGFSVEIVGKGESDNLRCSYIHELWKNRKQSSQRLLILIHEGFGASTIIISLIV